MNNAIDQWLIASMYLGLILFHLSNAGLFLVNMLETLSR